ncbi:MAG TPA: glycogen/starch/alpha-glucan phosphorylase [Erysipelotrichaceae bacterium]|nr:glycogen/starch/alpha-glucan phosphorylase [Erysipelotrichaceae bacterium]
MFRNKQAFKKEYAKRLLETYGVSVENSHITERYQILGEMVRDYANLNWGKIYDRAVREQKALIYFSMEFLIGRLLINNLQNMGIYEVTKRGLEDLGISIHELEEEESDAGLGNGGLGRLAACFLDSIASLGYIGHGNCIRYTYGFFRQRIIGGRQVELPDQWLTNGNAWEVRKPKYAVEVKFYGYPESYLKEDGTYAIRTVKTVNVRAVPYDVPIVGYRNNVTNTLRLWNAEPSSSPLPKGTSFKEYCSALEELCHGLYPDDSTEEGRILRLRQQYFLVSAGLQSTLGSYYRHHGTLLGIHEKYVFQLNDTHPILAIPEMMRIMMDEYGMGWDESWNEVRKSMAFTNHTIMPEALERWPVSYVQNLVPRVYMIIEEINRRFNNEMTEQNLSNAYRYRMNIIKDGQIHMCNLAIYTCFSVNGVAALHTEILKTITFKEFYECMPNKFNNKTNGVTHRRWLVYSNPQLTKLINEKIGDEWITNMELIKQFEQYKDDEEVLERLAMIKKENKMALAKYIKEHNNIEVDVNAIFDVQIKRLHAYKRQLLNIFHVIYLYQRMKNDSSFRIYPRVYIFGAKAAPSYAYAKKIIELILAVAEVVNNDPEISPYLKVVFIENYRVTLAELIIPATDVSEQISTAGKEASGTSNMKFMMNGAITLGTMDGANIEIVENVGNENAVIFGLRAHEVEQHVANYDYNPWDVYNSDERIKNVLDSLLDTSWSTYNRPDRFKMIFSEVMDKRDEYFILADFASYVEAQEKIEALYKDQKKWQKICLINIANSSFFTSDRTIESYAQEIWNLKKVV